MKLQKMTDFINERYGRILNSELGLLCGVYAKFLQQRLTLGMFVPVDEEGNVMSEPIGWLNEECSTYDCCNICKCEQYKEAKEKVLFKGFDLIKSDIETLNHTTFIENEIGEQVGYNKSWENEWNLYGIVIEDLIGFNLELTPSALKQISL